MAYPSNVGCGLVVPTNKDTPLYLSTPYTRYELNSRMTIVYLLHGILTSKVIKVHCYKPGPGKETPYMMLLHRVYGQFLKINV